MSFKKICCKNMPFKIARGRKFLRFLGSHLSQNEIFSWSNLVQYQTFYEKVPTKEFQKKFLRI